MNDKLMSIRDCEEWIAQGSDTEDGRITNAIVKQLADTMRENEELKASNDFINATINVSGESAKLALTRTVELQRENERLRGAIQFFLDKPGDSEYDITQCEIKFEEALSYKDSND